MADGALDVNALLSATEAVSLRWQASVNGRETGVTGAGSPSLPT